MALKLPRVTRGQAPTLLDAQRANQLIDAVNALIESKGTGGIKVTVEGNGRLVISGEDLQAGGIDGFEEETLDIVEDDNEAGQRVFLTKEV
jgi:hypothetical protein